MTNEQAMRLADELEDLAAMLTHRAQRIRRAITTSEETHTRIETPFEEKMRRDYWSKL